MTGDLTEPTSSRSVTQSPWLTLAQGARHANLSEATLRREARAGRLRGFKVGGRRVWRFRAEDIDAWFEDSNGGRW